MNSKLIRRLRRETKANPAKAAALAVVLLVAIWFWAPLVIRWCSPAAASSDEAVAPIATAEPTASRPSVAPAGGSVSATATTTPPVTWQRLVQRIEQDPRMQPNRQPGHGRDPFGPSAAELAAAKVKQQQQSKIKRVPPAELLPADAGLVLNSTLVGSGRRMAMIGGEPYWEGDIVPASHGTDGFRLVEIYPRQVVLERQGKHYGLEIKSTNPFGHDAPLASDPNKPQSDNAPLNVHTRNASPHSSNPFAKFNTHE